MSRPSFALSILLASLAGSLLMVGTAKCQNGLNGLQIAAGHVCAPSAGELYAYEEDVYGDPEAQVNSTITAEENVTESNPDQCPYNPDQDDSQCPYYHGGSYHSYNHYPDCPYAGGVPNYGQAAADLAREELPAADGSAYPDDVAQVAPIAQDVTASLECLRSGYDAEYDQAVYGNSADVIEPTDSAIESSSEEAVTEVTETEADETNADAYPYNYEDYGYEYDYDYDYSCENESAQDADVIEPTESATESSSQEAVTETTETEADKTEVEPYQNDYEEYGYEYDYDYDYSYENESAQSADVIESTESATESSSQEAVEETTETEADKSEVEPYQNDYEDYGYEYDYDYDYSYENESAQSADVIESTESVTESSSQEAVTETTETEADKTEVEPYQYDQYDYDDYDYGYGYDYSSEPVEDSSEQQTSETDSSNHYSDDESYGYEYDEIQFHYDGYRSESAETNDRGWYLDDDSDRDLVDENRSADELFEPAGEATGTESLDAADAAAEPASQPESIPAPASDDYQGWDADYGYSDGYDDWGYEPHDPSVPAVGPLDSDAAGLGGLDFDGLVRVIREAVASTGSQLQTSLIDLREEIESALCGSNLEQAWYDAAQETRQQQTSVQELPENQCDLPRDEAYPWYECECWYND